MSGQYRQQGGEYGDDEVADTAQDFFLWFAHGSLVLRD